MRGAAKNSVPLGSSLRAAVMRWSALDAGRGAEGSIRLSLPDAGPAVGLHTRDAIFSCVRSLIDLARQRGGPIAPTVGLRRRAPSGVAESWVVFVEDTGPLLDPTLRAAGVLPELWRPVAGRVEALGARLQVEDAGRVTPGVVAWITIPAAELAARSTASASLAGKRVLVVDDNRVNLAVLEGLLRRWGCSVAVAEDGREATVLVGHQPFDLVLMDLQMPVMDGYSATRWIRSQPAPVSRMPVVAVSANTMSEDRVRSRQAGVDAHVGKPVHAGRLETLLTDVLRKRSARMEPQG